MLIRYISRGSSNNRIVPTTTLIGAIVGLVHDGGGTRSFEIGDLLNRDRITFIPKLKLWSDSEVSPHLPLIQQQLIA